MARGHVDINERRLRPIYDALDCSNNKKALQEAEKLLKKQKDFTCAKALRGLALLRLGRVEESAAQVKEVHSTHPTEESILQVMSICYREMHKLDMISELYENAHHAAPDSEEILSALFMSHVRLHQYKKQQLTAMKLHKLQPKKNPYYFWAVMSIVMQAQEADSSLAKSMFLPLAERMTEKYTKEGKIEAEAEVHLYLIILELSEKYQAACDVLDGPLAERLQSQPGFREMKRADLLLKLEKWSDANKAFRTMLLKQPDHWQFYKNYFFSLFHLIDSPSGDSSSNQNTCSNSLTERNGDSPSTNESETKNETERNNDKESEDVVDYTVQMAFSFIQHRIKEGGANQRVIRGPYLAQLELLKLLVERGKGEEKSIDIKSGSDLIRQYYEVFGDKLCCHDDLRPYFCLIDNATEKKLFSDLLEEHFGKSKDGLIMPEDTRQMQRHLTLCTCSRSMGDHVKLSSEARLELVKEYIERYTSGLKFGCDLLKTEQQYSDNYMILASYLLYDVWASKGTQSYLWRAIVLLERLLVKSPSNAQAKFLLIRMYCELGAFGPCPNLYDSMEIKHIQNDSLGYTVTNHISRLGHISSSCSLFETMLRFFTINHKETTEYLVQSYKYGSFTKILEFVKFRDKLKNSFQYASAKTERMLLDLTMETVAHGGSEQMVAFMEIHPEELGLYPLAELCDNRDLSVVESWSPQLYDKRAEWRHYSYKEEMAWLKIRNLVIRVLSQAILLAQEFVKEGSTQLIYEAERDKAIELFQTLKTELLERLEEGKQFSSTVQYPVCGPFRTRLSVYIHHGLSEVLATFCDITALVFTNVTNKQHSLPENAEKLLETFVQKLTVLTEDSVSIVQDLGDGNIVFRADQLEISVLLVELMGQLCILLGSWHKILRPWKAAISKKSRKKREQTQQVPELFEFCSRTLDSVQHHTLGLQARFRQLDVDLVDQDLSQLKIGEDILQGADRQSGEADEEMLHLDIKQRVIQSYRISGSEMLTFLHNKLEYLQNLKR